MAKTRSYKLLCPIARALDRVGDRWTLLILRDLHAGPARFSDLQRGLTGIAANLLTERLVKLTDDGLARKTAGAHGASVYELTELGKRTSDVILDLALLGGRFAPDSEVVPPGNLRTVATTLGAAAKRVASSHMSFDAAFVVDGEEMHLRARGKETEMLYETCRDPDLVFATDYLSLLGVTEGDIDPEVFLNARSTLKVMTPGKETEFSQLMASVMELMTE